MGEDCSCCGHPCENQEPQVDRDDEKTKSDKEPEEETEEPKAE